MADRYLQDLPGAVIVNDDGKGEIADLVVIDLPEPLRRLATAPFSFEAINEATASLTAGQVVRVLLCHCKHTPAIAPRHDLRDLDQLVGQAGRSTKWTVPTRLWSELAVRTAPAGRASIWEGDSHAVRQLFGAFATTPPPTTFAIHLAQPGVRVAGVNEWAGGRVLLSGALSWATQHGAEFRLFGSGSSFASA
jgi:hypothetical protein